MRKRVQAKPKEIKERLKVRRYTSIPEMGRWLHSVVANPLASMGLISDSQTASVVVSCAN
jgi:hypothetical protein